MTLKIGVVGTGKVSDHRLIPSLAEVDEVKLWSVMSRDMFRARQFAAGHGACSPEPGYDDLSQMLADPELDAIIIATPDKLHAKQALQAIRAGKHVLVEKPMATDLESAQEMVNAAKEQGVCLAVAYHHRWHMGLRKMQEAVVNGAIGTPRHMYASWSWQIPTDRTWRARSDFGRWWSLASLGTHLLDIIRWFITPAGGEIAQVKSVTSSQVWNSSNDETAILSMRFESGATAELCSSIVFDSTSRVEIYGDQGFIICHGALGGHGGGQIITHQGAVDFPVVNPYVGEIKDFVRAASSGTEPEVSGVEGLENVKTLLEA